VHAERLPGLHAAVRDLQQGLSRGCVQDVDRALADLSSLWRRERQEARARAAALRRDLTLAERVKRGLALADLEVVDSDAAPGGRVLLWIKPRGDVDLESVRIGQGDPVRLWWDDPDGDDAVRAVVARRKRDQLAVMLDDVPERLDDGGFRLDVDAPEATFDRGDRAIARFRELERGDPLRPLRQALFGAEQPAFGKIREARALDPDLNAMQILAVDRALAAETISLVLGPPGTGKTRTLAEIVRRAIDRGERVLVTAASNTAVDNLAERLALLGAPLVRLGHPARVAPAIEEHTLDALMTGMPEVETARRWMREAQQIRNKAFTRFNRGAIGHRERREILGEADRLRRDARLHMKSSEQAILARHPIVCATAAGAYIALLDRLSFDRVVLDEATQAPDPIALVALARAPKATLAGDPHQLPPTVISREAEEAGLGTTFFERLSRDRPEPLVTMLEVQHRMHEALMRFPSKTMYGDRLIAHPSVASRTLEDLGVRPDPLRPGPFVFIDTAGKGWNEERGPDDTSTENPGQAERVVAELVRLISRGVSPSSIAIITPYHAQARRLRDALTEQTRAGLEIGTVDGFQGREKEVVIVDLVRSNDDREIGFLADVRRMNVAITRARRLLLVIGDSATLSSHPFYASFLAHAEATGAWISAWDDDAPPL
jgi:ATP-dependent RNA/DNA helicase IGHMBP2